MSPQTLTVASTLALANAIGLQAPVCARLAEVLTPTLLDTHAADCAALTEPSTAANTWKALVATLGDGDPDGMKLLGLYLAAACITREKYREAGISDTIFLETMDCFSRFLQETYDRTGAWAFDRGFWAWRQLCCLLFRLGTLEFEYRLAPENEQMPDWIAPGTPILNVHIPSNAVLTGEALKASYQHSNAFFAAEGRTFCHDGPPVATLCHTWLLSQPLRSLLPPTSGIRRFGDDYEIYANDPADESFYLWLFHGKKPPDPLPQNTSLQRTVHAFLEKGGKIGAGLGVIR